MFLRTRLYALAVTTTILAAAPNAHATLARAVPFDEKVENASAIILGKVAGTRSEWDAEHRWIVTYTTFKVEDTMKGAASPELTVITPGGTVGNIQQETIGVPAFQKDQDNIVFTKDTPHGKTVLFFDQGAYDVGEAAGDRIVSPRPTGAVLVDTQRGTAVEQERVRTLREFKHDLRDSMERTRAAKMELIRTREKKND